MFHTGEFQPQREWQPCLPTCSAAWNAWNSQAAKVAQTKRRPCLAAIEKCKHHNSPIRRKTPKIIAITIQSAQCEKIQQITILRTLPLQKNPNIENCSSIVKSLTIIIQYCKIIKATHSTPTHPSASNHMKWIILSRNNTLIPSKLHQKSGPVI